MSTAPQTPPPSAQAAQAAPRTPASRQAGPVPGSTDGFAIASFVCALCGLSIIPIVLGHVSLGRIKRYDLGGQAFAIIGLVIGYLTLAVIVVAVIAILGTVIWSVNA